MTHHDVINQEVSDSSICVQVFAETLPQLAETAKRFLETAQAFKPAAEPTSAAVNTTAGSDTSSSASSAASNQNSSLAPNQDSFDKDLQEIQDLFFFIVSEMLTKDSSTAVKRALLAVRKNLHVFSSDDGVIVTHMLVLLFLIHLGYQSSV